MSNKNITTIENKGSKAAKLIQVEQALILNEIRSTRTITARLLITIFGFGMTLPPIPFTLGRPKDMLYSILFMGLIFGTLFGIVFGLCPLIRAIQQRYCIKAGRYKITKDIVVDKQKRDFNERLRCLLFFEQHAKKSNEGVWRDEKEYNKVQIGDEYYLIYRVHSGNVKELICIFPVKEYCLEEDMT